MYKLTTPDQGIELKEGIGLQQVLRAIEPFLAEHDVELHPMLDPDEIGAQDKSVPMSDPQDVISLDAGHLRLCLNLSTMPLAVVDLDLLNKQLGSIVANPSELSLFLKLDLHESLTPDRPRQGQH